MANHIREYMWYKWIWIVPVVVYKMLVMYMYLPCDSRADTFVCKADTAALSCCSSLSHSTENWIFLKLHVADTTAQYWEKRDINPNVFILKFGCDT